MSASCRMWYNLIFLLCFWARHQRGKADFHPESRRTFIWLSACFHSIYYKHTHRHSKDTPMQCAHTLTEINQVCQTSLQEAFYWFLPRDGERGVHFRGERRRKRERTDDVKRRREEGVERAKSKHMHGGRTERRRKRSWGKRRENESKCRSQLKSLQERTTWPLPSLTFPFPARTPRYRDPSADLWPCLQKSAPDVTFRSGKAVGWYEKSRER